MDLATVLNLKSGVVIRNDLSVDSGGFLVIDNWRNFEVHDRWTAWA